MRSARRLAERLSERGRGAGEIVRALRGRDITSLSSELEGAVGVAAPGRQAEQP